MTSIPYVVTDDLGLVLSDLDPSWRPDVSVQDTVSKIILASLQEQFTSVEQISSNRISGFICEEVSNTDIPVISLAGAVDIPVSNSASLEFSRSARLVYDNQQRKNLYIDAGLMPRRIELPSIDDQITQIRARFDGENEVAIADDVVFSGGTVLDIVERLAAFNIAVTKVIASVALSKSIERLGRNGIEVVADRVYEDVIDEVCMRDFLIGVPGGGRNIVMPDGTYASAPYVIPFGETATWASMSGDLAQQHSQECLKASSILWSTIDSKRGFKTRFGELAKPVVLCDPQESIVEKIDSLIDRGLKRASSNTL